MWGPEGIYLTVMFWGPLKGPGMCKLAYLLHVGAECLSQSAAAVPWGAQGDSQTFNILYLLKSCKWATQLIFPSISPSPPPSWGNWWCGGSTRLFLSGISLSSHSLWNHPMLSPVWCHPQTYPKETLWGPPHLFRPDITHHAPLF